MEMTEEELDRFLAVYVEQRSRLASRELMATIDELIELGRQHGASESAVRTSIDCLCVRGTVALDGPYVVAQG
jgi:hypothetical protein